MTEKKYESQMKIEENFEGDRLFVRIKYDAIPTEGDLAFVSEEGRTGLRGMPDVFRLLEKELKAYVQRSREPDVQLATLALGQMNRVGEIN